MEVESPCSEKKGSFAILLRLSTVPLIEVSQCTGNLLILLASTEIILSKLPVYYSLSTGGTVPTSESEISGNDALTKLSNNRVNYYYSI